MLPGCGMVMARQLLQHFGSVERIVRATEDELRTLRGIGAKKARQMVRVLHAEYEAVDTERDLEDAIEAAPELLFRKPVQLLARQHYIFSDEERRHFVDLVFLAPEANELILVELKRGRLAAEHARQLRRYLDKAPGSKLLASFLEKGARLRGILATVEEGTFEPKDRDIETCIVNRKHALDVLKCLRALRLERMAEELRQT